MLENETEWKVVCTGCVEDVKEYQERDEIISEEYNPKYKVMWI
jgi:hypothetical protein